MRSSCEGYRKAGNFLSSLLHLVSIDWKWESFIFFFLLGGMFQPCPAKEIQAIFKKDIHYLEVWVLVSHFSEKVSLIQELLPEIGLKNNTLLYYACVCLKLHFCAGQRTDFSRLIKHDLFLKLYKFLKRLLQASVEASTRARSQSYWVHPYASYLGSRDGSLPPAPHPSRKKSREEGDICLYQKSKIFASNPQWISTNIS